MSIANLPLDVAFAPLTRASRAPRVLDRDLIGVRGLTLRRFGWTALFVGLFTTWSTVANFLAADGLHPTLANVSRSLTEFIPKYTLWMVPATIAVSVADNLRLSGVRRTLALVAALLLAASVEVAVRLSLDPCMGDCTAFPRWPHAMDAAVQVLTSLAYTGSMAIAFFSRRRDQAIAAALHASEMARIGAERGRLDSELQAMQARVEPAFLLEVLQDVGARYAADRVAGGRMLDLLIQYLRAALPQIREPHSTLGREAALLRSYLGIFALRSEGALLVDCRVDDSVAEAPVVPMILLPLVSTAIQQQATSGTVSVAGREIEGRLRITLKTQGAIACCVAPASTLAEVRQRLFAMYGERASLVVDRTDAAAQVIVEIPHDSTHRDRR